MGGGGGILSGVTEMLFGKPKEPNIPVPEAPAPPAPAAKQDTGAIIQTGALDGADDRLRRSAGGAAGAQRRSSTLGSLGATRRW